MLIKLACILSIPVLAVLVWKTAEHFNRLPETSKDRTLIAWDTLALSVVLILLWIKLITM